MITSRTMQSWCGMIQRCYNQKRPNYADYGGRGIGVCDEWRQNFTAFLRDMGERPPGTSLDAIRT